MTENEWLSALKQNDPAGEIYRDMPNEVYHHKECPGISSTKLSLILDSYGKYLHALDHRTTNDDMIFGSAFHDRILLPDLYKDKYVVAPNCDKRSNANKEIHRKFEEDNVGKVILKQDDLDKIELMRNKLASIRSFNYLFQEGEPECSYFWNDKDTGVLCKCRPDWIVTNRSMHPIIIDIKTAKNSDRRNFQKAIFDRNYHMSAAFYCDGVSQVLGIEMKNFVLVVIEKEPPFEVGLYVIGPRSLELGRSLYKKALRIYKEHKDHPGLYHDQIRATELELIELPEWAFKLEE